ncbi:MAG: hypothetical protein ACXWID_11330 [Pyrinomonadaceae bacterium]
MRRSSPKANKIMLIRHAEKPDRDGEPFGVTEKGHRNKEALAVRGWQRAGALATLFAPTNANFQHGALARPKFLFASKPLRRKGSRRPIQTIRPLAQKLEIDINSNYQRADYESMLQDVFSCKGVVLVCWQREYIPQIASHILGEDSRVPADWPEDRYDMVWVFDLNGSSGRYTFKQVPQKLLSCDLGTPIK